MSSNLPPGCSINDIPGNRPEDIREEAFWEAFFNEVDRHEIIVPEDTEPVMWDDISHWLVRMITIARDLAYTEGFNDGRVEAELDKIPDECPQCGWVHGEDSPCVID